ncbi:MAG: arginine repressor [Ruminococcaceae bacterium]|nr:arginine repressor [Oscillospiraceae bacterium]
MKYTRQAMILDLIEKNSVETQEDLTALLKESGFQVTQATVSRDIKELKLIKITDENGVTKYSAMKEVNLSLTGKMLSVYSHAFLTADYANNIVVVKTLTGMAQAVAAAIDSLKLTEVLGSIAGDDTIILVCRTEKYAEDIVKILVNLVR